MKNLLAVASLLSSSFTLGGGPTLALPNSVVETKLDTIIVFMPSNKGEPRSIPYKIEGQIRNVYFAAFSSTAVEDIITDLTKREKKGWFGFLRGIFPKGNQSETSTTKPFEAKDLKFEPASLSKFDSLIQPKLEENSNARVLYIPDPSQRKFSKKLLKSQGIKGRKLREVLDKVPIVFCPQPSLLATIKVGPSKGETFVPCSTDYKTVKTILDNSIAANPKVKEQKPKVVAITLPQFARLLTVGNSSDVEQLRVLPTPSSLKYIKKS